MARVQDRPGSFGSVDTVVTVVPHPADEVPSWLAAARDPFRHRQQQQEEEEEKGEEGPRRHRFEDAEEEEGEQEEEGQESPYDEEGVLEADLANLQDIRLIQGSKEPAAAAAEPRVGTAPTAADLVEQARQRALAAAESLLQAGAAPAAAPSPTPAAAAPGSVPPRFPWLAYSEEMRRRRSLGRSPVLRRSRLRGARRCFPFRLAASGQSAEASAAVAVAAAVPEVHVSGFLAGPGDATQQEKRYGARIMPPGAAKPKGGVRRSAVGPLLQMLRSNSDGSTH